MRYISYILAPLSSTHGISMSFPRHSAQLSLRHARWFGSSPSPHFVISDWCAASSLLWFSLGPIWYIQDLIVIYHTLPILNGYIIISGWYAHLSLSHFIFTPPTMTRFGSLSLLDTYASTGSLDIVNFRGLVLMIDIYFSFPCSSLFRYLGSHFHSFRFYLYFLSSSFNYVIQKVSTALISFLSMFCRDIISKRRYLFTSQFHQQDKFLSTLRKFHFCQLLSFPAWVVDADMLHFHYHDRYFSVAIIYSHFYQARGMQAFFFIYIAIMKRWDFWRLFYIIYCRDLLTGDYAISRVTDFPSAATCFKAAKAFSAYFLRLQSDIVSHKSPFCYACADR